VQSTNLPISRILERITRIGRPIQKDESAMELNRTKYQKNGDAIWVTSDSLPGCPDAWFRRNNFGYHPYFHHKIPQPKFHGGNNFKRTLRKMIASFSGFGSWF
jgi:hypothetical protein